MEKREDTKEQVYNYLKKQIITCELMPGTVIQIDAVAEQLQVSKTPVREALLQLQWENYVIINPRHSTTVASLSLKEQRDIYEARRVIEHQLLLSIPPERLRDNQEALQQLENAWLDGENIRESRDAYVSFLTKDLHFHSFIMELSDNPYLVRYAKELLEKSQRFWYIAFYYKREQQVRSEHLAIVRALKKGNIEMAAKANEEHIIGSQVVMNLMEA